jgi:hypothetical protein
LDRVRSEVLGRERRAERGTERDVSGSYNNVFVSFKRTGARTSLIVDPPNGRIPALTPEAQKLAGAEREFRAATGFPMSPELVWMVSSFGATLPAQKSGLSAVGTSEYVPGYHSRFSAQTSSTHSSKARRNVTVADQGIVNAAASSTVSWTCSPLPL